MSQPLRAKDVRAAYRMILGREPETDDVVDAHVRNYASVEDLRQSFLDSHEFAMIRSTLAPSPGRGLIPEVARGYYASAERIDVHVGPETMAKLADRTRAQWTALGASDPFWSVLTDDRYRSARIDEEALAEFRESGRKSAELVELSAIRGGQQPPRGGTCLELGCGVGRVTRFLAERFDTVIAVDISPGNLALCERYMADEGIANVETRLVSSLEDFEALPEHDFFYSVIVLQHNAPPVQLRVLETLLAKLRPGGQCVFQTVADQPGYSFNVNDYLKSPSPEMEVHALPMAAITRAMREAGVALDTARLDPWVGFYGSYTFAGHRPGQPA